MNRAVALQLGWRWVTIDHRPKGGAFYHFLLHESSTLPGAYGCYPVTEGIAEGSVLGRDEYMSIPDCSRKLNDAMMWVLPELEKLEDLKEPHQHKGLVVQYYPNNGWTVERIGQPSVTGPIPAALCCVYLNSLGIEKTG